jgi:hypothetical protein
MVRRLAVVLLIVVGACSGKPKKTDTAGPGSGSQALYAKKTAVSWGISGGDVFLQLTDETGKQRSFALGTYTPECKTITPKPEMKAMTAVACTGVELDAVISGDEIIVVKGDGTDPMAREEIQRVKAPGGAAVVVGP